MSDKLQLAKQRVRDFYRQLDASRDDNILQAHEQHCSVDYHWRGCHPFNEISNMVGVAEHFWQPIHTAFRHLQRRQDVFMAGDNQLDDDDTVWVVSMGHLMGLFDQHWLGVAPPGRMAFIRYCEFVQVRFLPLGDAKICQSAMFIDIPGVMVQAGVNPFPPQTGAQLIQPGPITHTGLLFDEQSEDESEKTLSIINQMIGDLGNWDNDLSLEEELALSWHNDMIWWGPTGIGATYTIERYAKQHSGVFRNSFSERIFNGHVCKFAEGEFGGFFGWPNLTLKPSGGFMGMAASEQSFDMRVIDIYRRDGEKLAENWVFIDLLYFYYQQGIDILARNAYLSPDFQRQI
ncbi:polyketide cyclase [Veronia nyctiphanis]|uniref:Polyketide cyclase n=1 Tax=Veronia nyctiphanis TaxID=1278244 RepID=A0A4Q0YLK1_9GAMM|nr:nuclear transport factor 2 family protein [Veronia nyctiphanis]RXJ69981.1 polyketide cyclase [Veronia nyctiphanis]